MREKNLVRAGYNKIGGASLEARRHHSPDTALLERLTEKLRPHAVVMDAG